MGISSVTGTWEIGVNWPYPKLYFTDYYIIAVAVKGDNLAIYDMTNSTNVWTATERIDLGAKSGIISVDIANFDIYTVIVVNKGTTKEVYERNPSTKAITLTAVTIIPGGNSCCNFKGQLIIGGLYSTGAPWSSLGTCSIAWGDIGSNIMNPSTDIVAGFSKLPWDENGNNSVLKVLPLSDYIIIYGEQGIGSCKPVLVGDKPAMGFKPINNAGVLSTYAVAGDADNIHGFVDQNYEWNIVTSEGVKNLGYYNYLSTLTGIIVVSYDATNKRFYISDGVKSYVYNNIGMYSTHQCVSSAGVYKKTLCGFVKDNSDNKLRLTTTSFDTDIQDQKTIESVETGLVYNTTGDETVSGSLATKYDYKGDFIQTDYVLLNDRGIFTKKLTGREFKIYLEGNYEVGADFQLNNIKVKMKFPDKRNSRGRINVN